MLGFITWFPLCLLIVASIEIKPNIHQHWQKFKRAHGKNYHPEVDHEKKTIFAENVKKIMEHNILADLGHKTHKMGINKYSDMSHEEFVKTMNGLKNEDLELQTRSNNPNLHEVLTRAADLPKQVDWSKEGAVTPVKDQGECGSCWSFSATGAMEGAWFRKTGQLTPLSEQNLVDCARDGNDGCDGGLPHNAFQYVIDRKGVDKETCYPYYGMQFKCFFNPTCIGANITEYKMIESGDEDALKEAVATVGPISIAIDASHESLQHYKEGIYTDPHCDPENLDHAVLLVGYGTSDDGQDYWLIKNSWSESWGINGYFKMARNKNNTCGVASYGTYPIA